MGSELLVEGLNFIGNPGDFLPLMLAEAFSLSKLGSNLINIFQVALGLGFVIFVHELGHFLAAKTFGVRCDKFYIGFDVPISIGPIKFPRTLGKFTWGETEYGIGIIPLGGYVKMLGQDDDPRRQAEENAKIRATDDPDAQPEDIPLDPRSYPAKPVWQRMIIISAGVVMNLIFAVILAGIAYRAGVPYTPAVVGAVDAGGPAWQQAMQPGDQILRFGKQTTDNPKMFYSDFAVGVAMRGFDDKSKAMPITVLRDDKRLELSVAPTNRLSDKNFYRVGVIDPTAPQIGTPAYRDTSFLSQDPPDLQPNDVVIAVNDETLPAAPQFGAVLGYELTQRLQANWEDPVTLTVERKGMDSEASAKTLEVTLPPVPVKSFGLGFQPGPVVAIQAGSPGEKAGVQVGDVITAVNGETVTDGLKLPSMIARLAGQEITLSLSRSGDSADSSDTSGADAETLDVVMQGPEKPIFEMSYRGTGALTLGGLGIAFDVTQIVSSVDKRNADSGIQVGDELVQFQWTPSASRKQELADAFTKEAFQQRKIDSKFNVAALYEFWQVTPAGEPFKCFFRRGTPLVEQQLVLAESEDWYWHQRGILLTKFMDVYQTNDIMLAAKLGVWETSRRFTEVLTFLRMLVTGKIGASGLGGPVAIVQAASGEAGHGVSRLMLFLTLLSANLAILNFLPIPALDGGHMIFLLAEAIRGKPVSEALQIRLTMVGVLGLLSLMAFVIVNDIMRLVG